MSNFSVQPVKTVEQLDRVWNFAAPILDLPVGKHTLQYYTEQFTKTPTLLVFAEKDDRVCGCVLASIEGDHVLVGPVAVAEDCRRMGIGSAMLREVEVQARAFGLDTLILGALGEAEPFYLSCGFRPNLFVQLPDTDSVGRLEALNEQYEVVWRDAQEGWSRLMLRTPAIDKDLQEKYDRVFPNCHTQYVFIKQVITGFHL